MYEIVVKKTTTTRRAAKPWVLLNQQTGQFGYAPEEEVPTTETVEIYSQKVDELDLAAVIIAVNNLLGMVIRHD